MSKTSDVRGPSLVSEGWELDNDFGGSLTLWDAPSDLGTNVRAGLEYKERHHIDLSIDR